MKNFAKTFVSNMANGDIFYSRLSFGTNQQQFFGIFQFLKGGSFSSPLILKVKKNVGTQRVKVNYQQKVGGQLSPLGLVPPAL